MLGTGAHKTLPEKTGEVIHRHKGFEYVSTTTSNFPWPQNFNHYDKSSNIVFEVGKYHSWPNILAYLFRSGIDEQMPLLPSQVQVTVPALVAPNRWFMVRVLKNLEMSFFIVICHCNQPCEAQQ